MNVQIKIKINKMKKIRINVPIFFFSMTNYFQFLLPLAAPLNLGCLNLSHY